MKNRLFLIVVLLLIFFAGIYLAYIYSFSEKTMEPEVNAPVPLPDSSRAKVETYVREHISELSPEPEVLGGKFYMTKIVFETNTRALVEYEDGHNAFKAQMDFFINLPDTVRVLNFTVIQRN